MNIMEVFQQRKQKISQMYNKNYWNTAFSGYTNVNGRINWDSNTNNISYNQPTKALPTLNAMWSDFLRGAQSRGVKADFLTFKKMYDVLKLEKQKGLVNTLTQASVSGVPIDKLHELLRNEPGLRSELVKTISTSDDPAVREALAQYVPPQQQSMAQFRANNPGTLGALTLAGTAGAAYGLSPNAPLSSEEIGQRLDKMGRVPKVPAYYDKNLNKWVGKEPSEYTAINKKINDLKAPVKKNYKTVENFNKANKSHATKMNTLISEREGILNEANKKYKTNVKTFDTSKAALNRDIASGDKTRISKWLGAKSKMSPQMRMGVGLGAFIGGPMATSAIAKSMGFDQAGQDKVANVTTGLVAAGYSMPTIKKAFDVVKAIPAGQRTMVGMSRALAGKGIWGSLASAALAIGGAIYFGTRGSSSQSPKTSNTNKQPTFKQHDITW